MAKRQERERRYISEYTMVHFEPGTFVLNVPLGPIPEEIIHLHGVKRGGAFIRSGRRRVDAVHWTPEAYTLIESKIRDPLEGLGRLQTYRDLAAVTPDLPEYRGQAIKAQLVAPWSLEWVRIAASKAGIELVVWKPHWIDDYVRERQLYHTSHYRRAREDRNRMRELMGLE
jgi:hypothetical protein